RAVRVDDGLRPGRRPRREEDRREVGRRDRPGEGVEDVVGEVGGEVVPALGPRRCRALEDDDAPERRRGRREEASRPRVRELGEDLAERRGVVVPEKARQRDEHLHVRVRERVRDLVALPERRERDEDRARPEGAERDREPLEPVRREEPDARALADADAGELLRGGPGRRRELRPPETRGHGVGGRPGERLAAPAAGDRGVEERRQRRGHDANRSRSRPTCTLFAALRGSAATNSTRRGFLKPASRAPANATNAAASTALPSRRTTTAVTCSPRRGCGVPMTATSATSGCARSTSSTSAGETFSPPLMITSFTRPVT